MSTKAKAATDGLTYRLNAMQYKELVRFQNYIRRTPISMMDPNQALAFVRGWFQSQGIDDYPVDTVATALLRDARFAVKDTVGQPDGKFQPMRYVVIFE